MALMRNQLLRVRDLKDLKQTKQKKSRKKKIELTKENQDFLNTIKIGSKFKISPKYLVQ